MFLVSDLLLSSSHVTFSLITHPEERSAVGRTEPRTAAGLTGTVLQKPRSHSWTPCGLHSNQSFKGSPVRLAAISSAVCESFAPFRVPSVSMYCLFFSAGLSHGRDYSRTHRCASAQLSSIDGRTRALFFGEHNSDALALQQLSGAIYSIDRTIYSSGMFSPRGTPGSGRRQAPRTGGRKSMSAVQSGLLFSPRRSAVTARSTPTRVQSLVAADSNNYDVQTFGSSLPVKVMEALTTADEDDQISVKLEASGWAWMICGERLIVWKVSQTSVAKLSVCKDLPLPSSEFAYTADLISITSSAPLNSAPIQSISALVVSPDGSARFWPSLAHEGTYTEISLDLSGHTCNCVAAVKGGSFIVSSYGGHLLRLSPDSSGKLHHRPVQQGQGMLSGISRRVSSLFGIRGQPADLTCTGPVVQTLLVQGLEKECQVFAVLWVKETSSLFTLTSCGLSKWEVDESSEAQVLSWSTNRMMADGISEAVWDSESNYSEIKKGVNVSYLDLQHSSAGVVVLAAAWHLGDVPCVAYFCLVTLGESSAASPDLLTVEVTKYNPCFQSEEELQKTRLLVPEPSSSVAFLYNEELVFACSTGAGRGAVAEEKIPFSAPGDRIHGGGVCAGLPVFFSQNSGLVAVLARESASLLPETMEDSLCTSVAGAGPEVTPPKAEPVEQEDKTKLLKQAFLQFCRHDLLGAQALVDELFPGDGEAAADLDAVVTRIDLDLVDDYPACDPRWAESVPDGECLSVHPSLFHPLVKENLVSVCDVASFSVCLASSCEVT
ncbi:hypothetical protein DNTS_030243 [Danionella cerebrum]|uniref:Nucleoporin Nup133/Nup155-like N-terminal domain-containing protein n=1 Tax=Danionella cerebrum TaxID=2873325 RepID=A0A553Q8F0_9TELE|nr:hypothetical protein DNTS_030243 [Danionella translucida]TRY86207.1 hypothetical protein DNTS_030243 [Danionella translucida]TRY86209.1 hypothetical protein DNTS_030243 [Danionella translucida]